MKIGIIREEKVPPDSRVPLTPDQCVALMKQYPIEIIVAPSPNRCFKDKEYKAAGIKMQKNLKDCDVLMGVKEVPIDALVSDKIYFFFSHTIKEQPYNRKLLRAILQKNIQLIDYEVLTNPKGKRLIAFGVFAGMVGAHNGVLTYGRRTGAFELPRMKDFYDYAAAQEAYKKVDLPAMRIVLTGTGRVSSGAAMVLKDMGIRQVPPAEYLKKQYQQPVFTQLACSNYVRRTDGKKFVNQGFYQNPEAFESSFGSFAKCTDIMINGIYWDNRAPAFFTREDMTRADFSIQVIADVTCDIAPVSSIPSTIKASTIADPIFGYNPKSGRENKPHKKGVIDMMTIDNLPNELPRDASTAFGQQFTEHIIEELMKKEKSGVITRATVTKAGHLGPHFEYLKKYAGIKR